MGNEIGKTCLERSGEVDAEKEGSDEEATEEEKKDILIVEKEKVVEEHMLGGYFTRRCHFPDRKKKMMRISM